MLRSIFALLFLCSLPVWASEAPAGQEITMAEYMSHEFFRPYFAKGSQVVWEQCLPLFLVSGVLLAYLLKRKAWNR